MTTHEKAIEALIKKAIEGRNPIVFNYKKNPVATKVEPYLTGRLLGKINAKNQIIDGKVAVRAYYLKGATSQKITTEMSRWRIYLLENIEQVRIVDERTILNKSGYNSNDMDFEEIYNRRT